VCGRKCAQRIRSPAVRRLRGFSFGAAAMKEFLQGAVAVAAGVLIAAAVMYGTVKVLDDSIRIDVTKHECARISDYVVECRRH